MKRTICAVLGSGFLLLAGCSGNEPEPDPMMIMACMVQDQVCRRDSDCCSGLSCKKFGNFGQKVCRAD